MMIFIVAWLNLCNFILQPIIIFGVLHKVNKPKLYLIFLFFSFLLKISCFVIINILLNWWLKDAMIILVGSLVSIFIYLLLSVWGSQFVVKRS